MTPPKQAAHTPGQWYAEGSSVYRWLGGEFAGTSLLMCKHAQGSHEDARRIVACVNACEGIENDELERFPLKAQELKTENIRLRAERDALVEALTKAADTFRDFAAMDRALLKPVRAAASEIAEGALRTIISRPGAAMTRCWQCGGLLTNPFKRPVEGVERTLPFGEKVKMHKICAMTFDQDQMDRKITARPSDELERP